MVRQLPIPRQLQLTEVGGTKSHRKAKEGIKKIKAVRTGGGKERERRGNCVFDVCFVLLLTGGTRKKEKKNAQGLIQHLTVIAY